MKLKNGNKTEACNETALRTLGDDVLGTVSGGAKTACDTLHDLMWTAATYGDVVGQTVYQSAMEATGCFKK